MASIPDPLFTFRGDMTAIHSLYFENSCHSEYLYASTESGIIHKWNLQSCREETKLKISDEACLSVKSINNYLISQSKGGDLNVYKNKEGSLVFHHIINLDYWGFCKFEITRSKLLICPLSSSAVNVFNLDGQLSNTFLCDEKIVLGEVMVLKCLTIFESEFCFVLYESGYISLFKINGVEMSNYKITADCPMALDFDGISKGIIGTSGDTILGFHLTTDLQVVKWKETVITNPGVSCVAIRPDNKIFAVGCWDSNIRIFSMKSIKLLVVLKNHKETILDISYSPFKVDTWNTKWLLAAAGKDGRITLWNLY